MADLLVFSKIPARPPQRAGSPERHLEEKANMTTKTRTNDEFTADVERRLNAMLRAAGMGPPARKPRKKARRRATIEVLPPDLVAAGQRLGLFAGRAADRTELAQIVMHLVHAATKGK
jgi:hypothetical protein